MKVLKKLIAVTIILSQGLWSINGYANPDGENVTSGSATFDRSAPNTLTINQATDKLITNWKDFSIAANETTRFNQPSTSSIALNRVTGGNPSDIFGTLSSNGIVYLINQNGILFAPGSQVNVGGLVASTLDITDANFLSGQYQTVNKLGKTTTVNGYNFNGVSGFASVINQGTININAPGGYAALLGSTVENSGSIIANAGMVALGVGQQIAVNLDATGVVSAVVVPVALTVNTKGSNDAILNSGLINANGGTVILNAQSLSGLFKNLINNEGIIQANTVSSQNGVVSLSANGDINLETGSNISDVSSTGSINVSGDNIKLREGVITSAGNVTLKSTDQILNLAGPHLVNITAQNLSLSAVNGIGSLVDLITNVNNLSASNSISGDIAVSNAVLLNATSVNNNSGDIRLSTDSGDLKVGKINAGLGNVTLNSVANIYAIDANNLITANKLSMTAQNNIGMSAQRINFNVNNISGVSQAIGDIYLNSMDNIILDNLNTTNGLIDVISDGQITASHVVTAGSSPYDSISLKTIFGDINVGTVSASGGVADVTLNSAGSINDANSMVTANNLSLISGVDTSQIGLQLFLNSPNVVTTVVNGYQVLAIKNQAGAAGYDVYFQSGLGAPWQKVASNYTASNASTTVWTSTTPAVMGAFSSYYVQVASAATGTIGSSANRINTNVNNLSANAQVGDVYLNQAKSVTLRNVQATSGVVDVISAGNMTANNVLTGGSSSNSITLKTTAGDIDVGVMNAAAGLANVNLNAAGNITDNSANSMITAKNLNVMVANNIGSFVNPLNLNVYSVDGVSWNKGDVYLKTTGDIVLGRYYSANFGLYNNTILGANNGIVSVQADGNITVNSVIATNGGVSLISNNGSIYAGTSADYSNYVANPPNPSTYTLKTADHLLGAMSFNTSTKTGQGSKAGANVVASGYSYLSAINGKIGVANSGVSVPDVDAQLVGIVRPGISAVTGVLPSPVVNIKSTTGGIYYDDSSVFGVSQQALAASNTGNHEIGGVGGSLSSMNNPLGVFIEVMPGSSSALPAGATPTAGLLINFQSPAVLVPPQVITIPSVVNSLITGNNSLASSQVTNTIQGNQSVYFENLNPHLIRRVEVVAPSTVYAYHSLVDNNSSAVDNIKLEPEVYDYIDGRINLNPSASFIQLEGKR